jgi:HAD superfamily hydrolase (TIGR01509 family)
VLAVIFDFDGLILDTEVPEFQAWAEIYQDYGLSLALADWAVNVGTVNTFDPHADLSARLGRPLDREEIRRRRRLRRGALLAEQPVRPGVRDYLDAAAARGLKVAVASSSPRARVIGHLDRLGLLNRFVCIRGAEDVPRVKPDPALYQSALAALDVPSTAALALEDSPNGVLAAKRAGLFCVAVPNPLTVRLDLSQADLRVASLADLPLDRLLGLASQHRGD